VIEAVSQPTYYSAIPLRASLFTGHWRLALVIGLALAVIFAVKQHVIEVDRLRKGVNADAYVGPKEPRKKAPRKRGVLVDERAPTDTIGGVSLLFWWSGRQRSLMPSVRIPGTSLVKPRSGCRQAGKVLGAAHGDEHVCGAICVNSSRPAIFSVPSLAGSPSASTRLT
jgi:hypothetical protein